MSSSSPANVESSKSTLLRGVAILPPRQSDGQTMLDASLAVRLPPLRAEEPVASLRAALSEVLGLAHLTRYRLVVERRTDSVASGGNGGLYATRKEAVVALSPSSRSLAETMSEEESELVLDEYGDLSPLWALLDNADNIDNTHNTHNIDNSHNTVSTRKNTDNSHIADNTHNTDSTSNKSNDFDNAIENANSNANENGSPSAVTNQQIIIRDATNIAIRIVLEPYDLAAIRDQLTRVRQLLAGNAPHVRTLEIDDNSRINQGDCIRRSNDGDTNNNNNNNNNSSTNEGDQQSNEKKEKEGTKKQNGAKNGSTVSIEAEELEKNDSEGQTIKPLREAMATQLPHFPQKYDVTFTNSTSGGDLTNFYYLACGEEQSLIRNQEETNENRDNGSFLISNHKNQNCFHDTDDAWMDNDTNPSYGKDNKKTKNSQKKKIKPSNGRTYTSVKTVNEDSSFNAFTAGTKNSFSVYETERLIHDLNEKTIIPVTIRFSGYHSPPSHRRILGDLAYIEAIIPGGNNSSGSISVHITAFSLGFYVNRSTLTTFDPTPEEEPCYSHALLDCLLLKSKFLRDAWSTALTASAKRAKLLHSLTLSEDAFASLFRPATSPFFNNNSGAVLGSGVMVQAPLTFVPRIDSITVCPSWLVPLPMMAGKKVYSWKHGEMHRWSASRAEDELSSTFGMDIRGGGLRDWNEEFQSARELPVTHLGERIDRARMIHKVLSDFAEAALLGVKAIFDGFITPMNPNELARSHVYLHNNIFFSRAVDAGVETFKIIQGDRAAKKSASHEAKNLGVLHRMDTPGLHTLSTILVDYMGMRFVCQSVLPGILYGEKAHTLIYGTVEALSEFQFDEDMHKLLEISIGNGCLIATRTVLSQPLSEERIEKIKTMRTATSALVYQENKTDSAEIKSKTTKVCGPLEMKGIIGSDKRKYILDCTRFTPRDANWVEKTKGGTGFWEDIAEDRPSETIPASLDDDEWIACLLRPELVTHYGEEKLNQYLRDKRRSKDNSNENNVKVIRDENEISGINEESKKTGSEETNLDPNTSDDEETNESRAKLVEEFQRSLHYNVNVFLPGLKSIETMDTDASAQLENDEEEARLMAAHLWNSVLPALTKELRSFSGRSLQIPADGKSLTDFIHQRGINCRYLGRLAELARLEEVKDAEAEKAFEGNKRDGRLPRYRMPLCWLEQLECEIVARAAKHVLESYLIEQGCVVSFQPAQTIASFLSAVVSTGEESASETETRLAHLREGTLNEEVVKSLTLFDVGGNGDAVPKPARGRKEIWSDIEKEIGRRFRYSLRFYNKDSKVTDGAKNRALYTPLLRRICKRSGIRIAAKKYDMGGKCVSGGDNASAGRLQNSYPIAPMDIIDILPLVKHAASSSGDSFVSCQFNGISTSSIYVVLEDAKLSDECAHINLNCGNFPLASEYAQDAIAMYQRVVETPLHSQIAKCLKVSSKCHFYAQDHSLGIMSALKHLAVSVSLGGFDCMEVLTTHGQLSDIFLAAGKVKEGMKHLRAMQFLMEFMAGSNYSELSATYYKIGIQYFEAEEVEEAIRFYQVAEKKRCEDRMIDGIICSSCAMAYAHLGKFKEASAYEKTAYQMYLAFVGEDNQRTRISSKSLLQFMRLSLEHEKVSAARQQEQVKENAADVVAQQIKAEEDAGDDEDANKKRKSKKKKKKTKALFEPV